MYIFKLIWSLRKEDKREKKTFRLFGNLFFTRSGSVNA